MGGRLGERGVVDLGEVDASQVALVGGKAANLGELRRIDGIVVPPGFCVTTAAFTLAVTADPSIALLLGRVSVTEADDHDSIRSLGSELRDAVASSELSDGLVSAIAGGLDALGDGVAVAVRSSATSEDLPTASFAGQHDSYLNVIGPDAVVDHVRRCWISTYTDRAIAYRRRLRLDEHTVRMAVVVQRLVEPSVSGVMFTADPVTGDRTIATVEAAPGLGESVVSGLVVPDSFRVRDGGDVKSTISPQPVAIRSLPGGGIHEVSVDDADRARSSLSDDQVRRLVELGRTIEAHFGRPQDVEWSLADGEFSILQSRPITTNFPAPEGVDDTNRVYISVGHQQMMTDPMKPLGLSVWRRTARPPMHEVAGRLYVDVTTGLSSPTTRDAFLDSLGRADPLLGDALQHLVERDGFLPPPPEPPATGPASTPPAGSTPPAAPGPPSAPPIPDDMSYADGLALVAELIEERESSLEELERSIEGLSGEALLDFIDADIVELQRIVFDPRSSLVVLGGMEAAQWLDDHLEEWLGERRAVDVLTQSVPYNITSEMGLALLDVADAIRPHPAVVDHLGSVEGPDVLDGLESIEGGAAAQAAILGFLDRFGMRCIGEIDITRPRWSERPDQLLPAILGNVRNATEGEGARRFDEGRRDAELAASDVLERLRALPGGDHKADEAATMIDRVRAFAGFREYPKYVIVNRYFVYRQALRREAIRLVRAGAIRQPDDIDFLSLEELREVERTGAVDPRLIDRRRSDFESYGSLTPPRVLTSDGEAVAGEYRRDDAPVGSLVGLGVSGGVVEGRARVLHDISDADLEPGDILVTAFTDPSWTPLFVAITGLVTEVGGLMTHGAVVAREYGLPAVVGVERATAQIGDGQRIRVHGREGYVELLDD